MSSNDSGWRRGRQAAATCSHHHPPHKHSPQHPSTHPHTPHPHNPCHEGHARTALPWPPGPLTDRSACTTASFTSPIMTSCAAVNCSSRGARVACRGVKAPNRACWGVAGASIPSTLAPLVPPPPPPPPPTPPPAPRSASAQEPTSQPGLPMGASTTAPGTQDAAAATSSSRPDPAGPTGVAARWGTSDSCCCCGCCRDAGAEASRGVDPSPSPSGRVRARNRSTARRWWMPGTAVGAPGPGDCVRDVGTPGPPVQRVASWRGRPT